MTTVCRVSKPKKNVKIVIPKGIKLSLCESPLSSTTSTVFPSFNNCVQLSRSNLEFYNSHTAAARPSEKYLRLKSWIRSNTSDVHREINMLHEYYLMSNDEFVKQHVENMSYVYNVDHFTQKIAYEGSFKCKDELQLGDDCEAFYYKKVQQQQSAQEIEFDTNLFEEVEAPPAALETAAQAPWPSYVAEQRLSFTMSSGFNVGEVQGVATSYGVELRL